MTQQNKKKKLAFLVSGNGGLFQSVINSCKDNLYDAKVVCMISDTPSCYAIERSKNEDIPTFYFDKKNLSKEELQENIFNVLCKYDPDLIILTFNSLLTNKIITKFSNRIINVHPGLLPSFKGFGAIQQTIQSGVRYGGATVHFVDEYMDNGLIIAQAIIPITSEDTEETYGKKIFEQMVLMLNQVIAWMVNDDVEIRFGMLQIKDAKYNSYPICPTGSFIEVILDENKMGDLFRNISQSN
jgi:phosphoribosylglycinamide formyltransferase-1